MYVVIPIFNKMYIPLLVIDFSSKVIIKSEDYTIAEYFKGKDLYWQTYLLTLCRSCFVTRVKFCENTS